ncbi:15775_t:CDS:2 [Dentiscutata erythropus]|uniref:15775_t:CDS:1 n=1 Tax=Dentiscutata erythropus TaxID=1348616 RepID=A0A9N8ZXJ1_9GLOM|nr:15775_t:CDS:2 [Dentiscutata erythropus]
MSTLGNTSGYKPSVSEVSSNTTSKDSLTSEKTASSIEISTNPTFQLLKSNDALTKFRELWWNQGNIHPSARWEEASDVSWEKYAERTDMFSVHGNWEWVDRKVYVYDLPLGPHCTCSCAIIREIILKDPEKTMVMYGSVSTRADGMGKEADGSVIPRGKPYVNSNGVRHKPWPNLIIEVASLETEEHLLNVVKNYWLYPNRAHDVIAIKLIRSDTIISRMKAWHYCIDNRELTGELIPVTEFEFETINDENQIIIQPQQFTINIKTECIFHGMPTDFHIPTSISNPLTIDLYYVLLNMEEELIL